MIWLIGAALAGHDVLVGAMEAELDRSMTELQLPDSAPAVRTVHRALAVLDDHCIRNANNLSTSEQGFCAAVLDEAGQKESRTLRYLELQCSEFAAQCILFLQVPWSQIGLHP